MLTRQTTVRTPRAGSGRRSACWGCVGFRPRSCWKLLAAGVCRSPVGGDSSDGQQPPHLDGAASAAFVVCCVCCHEKGSSDDAAQQLLLPRAPALSSPVSKGCIPGQRQAQGWSQKPLSLAGLNPEKGKDVASDPTLLTCRPSQSPFLPHSWPHWHPGDLRVRCSVERGLGKHSPLSRPGLKEVLRHIGIPESAPQPHVP